ncbi:hypothetical protein QUW15_09450 [Desulfovibrio piger]|nr:hypothetical protein [Desulfovibrio piger]
MADAATFFIIDLRKRLVCALFSLRSQAASLLPFAYKSPFRTKPDALAAPFPLRPVRCGKKLKEANAREVYLPQLHDRYLLSIFSLKRCAFQTIRPVVSRKKRGFSAHFGPGGAVSPPRVSPFPKLKRS